MLNIGDKAPEFNLNDETGKKYSLKDLHERRILLYFYPKDSTPGCTIEACKFRDNYKRFKDLGVELLGIGKGDIKAHKKFKESNALSFPLLVDNELAIAKEYGVLKEKSMFGKKYDGISRDTFLIDKDGNIEMIWRDVNPITHVNEVLEYLEK